MSSFEDLVKSIFDISDKNINEIEKEIEKNEFDLLSFIGLILLTYNIEKDYLKLTNSERNYLSEKAANKTINLFDKSTKFETKKTFETLKRTSKKSTIYCDLVFGTGFETKSNKDDLVNSFAKEFIDKKYKGEKFSKRIWDNNNQISKEIQNEIDKLLKGQISVNEIKKNIEGKFNTSKFNASRLVDSEVARVHDQTFKKFCRDCEIDEVIYKATFCNTCDECKKDHNKKFKLEDAPQLPRHPQCHCYYVYDIVKQSGGRYEKFTIKWFDDIENKANDFYDKIRNDNSDIVEISKNTGWNPNAITQIKNHVFYDRHKLENGIFDILDPDYDMAVAWSRLINGNYKDRDILLLKHEYLESVLEKKYNLTNKEAHDKTTKMHDWVSVMESETGGGEDDPIYGTEK